MSNFLNASHSGLKSLSIAFLGLLLSANLTGCKKEETATQSQSTAQNIPDEFTVDASNNPAPGEILVAPFTTGQDAGVLYVLNEMGGLIKSKVTEGAVLNFKKWDIAGTPRYTYLVEDRKGYHIPGYYGTVSGYVVIADTNFNEIKRVYLLPHADISTATQTLVDGHDFILLGDDHYIVMSYYEKFVTNIPANLHVDSAATAVRVVAPVIQEIKGDQVIWQWDGTEYPELYENSVEGNAFSADNAIQDYAHMNSMCIDPKDNNLVCSFRNLDQLLKISRTDGSIVWRFGGKNSSFALTDNQQFLRQHHATYANGKLILLDNGLRNVRATSRVLEFTLDENAKTISDFTEFTIPGFFTEFMGSVQKHGDVYFIGGGSGNYFLEMDQATGVKKLEVKQKQSSYRAFKYYN